MKVGVFGSALNPMTMGHVDAIKQALEHCDKVLVVPSYSHPFGKSMKPFSVRCDIAEATISAEFDGLVEICRIEESIYDPSNARPVCTFDLLESLSAKEPDIEFVFLCGTDNVVILEKFYRYEEIISKWRFLELKERKQIRSTLVRNNIAKNKSITSLVSASVIETVSEVYK